MGYGRECGITRDGMPEFSYLVPYDAAEGVVRRGGIFSHFTPKLAFHRTSCLQVARWLHVHVRPSVRVLLRAVRSGSRSSTRALDAGLEALADGHWVLAFPDVVQVGMSAPSSKRNALGPTAVLATGTPALTQLSKFPGVSVPGFV